jgi:hypothetical protein
VVHEVCVRVVSRDGSPLVNSGRGGGVLGARGIESRDGTVTSSHVAVISVVQKIVSRDRSRRVNAENEGALIGGRVRKIDHSEGTVRGS